MIPPAESMHRIARCAASPEDLACAHLTQLLVGTLADVAAHGGTALTFTIPLLLTGFAAYDPEDVAARLAKAFGEAGYHVVPDCCPWTLNLSWNAPRGALTAITFQPRNRS